MMVLSARTIAARCVLKPPTDGAVPNACSLCAMEPEQNRDVARGLPVGVAHDEDEAGRRRSPRRTRAAGSGGTSAPDFPDQHAAGHAKQPCCRRREASHGVAASTPGNADRGALEARAQLLTDRGIESSCPAISRIAREISATTRERHSVSGVNPHTRLRLLRPTSSFSPVIAIGKPKRSAGVLMRLRHCVDDVGVGKRRGGTCDSKLGWLR